MKMLQAAHQKLRHNHSRLRAVVAADETASMTKRVALFLPAKMRKCKMRGRCKQVA